MTIDEAQNFVRRGDDGLGEVREEGQHHAAAAKGAQSNFADDEGMRQNQTGVEKRGERRFAPTKWSVEIDVAQDHRSIGRRLGGALTRGSLPPRRASRLAL